MVSAKTTLFILRKLAAVLEINKMQIFIEPNSICNITATEQPCLQSRKVLKINSVDLSTKKGNCIKRTNLQNQQVNKNYRNIAKLIKLAACSWLLLYNLTRRTASIQNNYWNRACQYKLVKTQTDLPHFQQSQMSRGCLWWRFTDNDQRTSQDFSDLKVLKSFVS